jgi:hypothetical protein
MREVALWLFFVLLGAVVLDLSRGSIEATSAACTEQVRALS